MSATDARVANERRAAIFSASWLSAESVREEVSRNLAPPLRTTAESSPRTGSCPRHAKGADKRDDGSVAIGRAHDSPCRASRTHASAAATSLRLAPCMLPRLSRTSSNATRACCSIQRSPRRTRTPGAGMVTGFLAMVACQSMRETRIIGHACRVGGLSTYTKPHAIASARTRDRATHYDSLPGEHSPVSPASPPDQFLSPPPRIFNGSSGSRVGRLRR
jgi:hypothetical protein